MSGFSVKGVIVASVLSFSLQACSTVIRTADPDAADALAMTQERAALKEAATELAWSPWPKPEPNSFAGRPAGAGEDRMTRERAVEIYLASLAPGADAGSQIAADARRHLVAAAVLVDIAERASDGPGPRLSDVAVLETSISDLRETRAVYLAALRRIDADDRRIDSIRDPLDAAVKKLSRVADELAENAMKKRSSNFAGPDTTGARTGAL